MALENLAHLDKQYLWHPFTPMSLWLQDDPLVIVAAEGMHLIDQHGKRYLDGVSSLWCNVHGHRVPEIDAAIEAQLKKVAHSTMLGLSNEPAVLLAERLMKIVPSNLKKVFYSDSGATATEVAFKIAAQYWFNKGEKNKNEFIGFAEAYHGDTFGAMSVGRTELFHRAYWPMLFKTHAAPIPRLAAPLGGRVPGEIYGSPRPPSGAAKQIRDDCLAKLETILQNNASRIAAICIEPMVQGAGGMIVQPEGFLSGVRELATKYNTLLIADEVAVGFGRTGKMFACEHENVQPDLMCVAKGITGGYLPLAATFATQEIFDAFLGQPWEGKTFYHGHTYTGNPLACAAALASLDLFEKNDLVKKVQEKSQQLAAMLNELRDLPHVAEIRQKGFMVGIELIEDKKSNRAFDAKRRVGAHVCKQIRKHGVLLRPLGDVVIVMPPLAMQVHDLSRVVKAIHTEIAQL
ncbi:MAG TPA: adenosylmethionine--8-amino-7-oxononanoate transaminase [Tepidisphaeraceae bacterium]|jgi:adenosylmethionine-8-amino-7-oxononanoate aminotransferase